MLSAKMRHFLNRHRKAKAVEHQNASESQSETNIYESHSAAHLSESHFATDTAESHQATNAFESHLVSNTVESHSLASTSESHSATNTVATHPVARGQPHDFWDRAYKLLREDGTSRRRLKVYEEILISELKDEVVSPAVPACLQGSQREKLMSALIVKKLKVMEDAQWKFQLANHTVEVKAQLEHLLKVVLFAKDFVTSAVSGEPHAALAWAGICVLLPLLLNPMGQQKALIEGLDYISTLVCRFTVIERLYHQENSVEATSASTRETSELSIHFEAQVVKLYSQVLGYQVQVVCQLLRPTMVRICRDIFKVDNWATPLADIKKSESTCGDLTTVVDSKKLDTALKEQGCRMNEVLDYHKKIQETTNEIATDLKHHRKVQQDWRQIDEESKCLQALRTSTYEEYKARNPGRLPNTCQWLLKNRKFNTWLDSESSDLLWVTADPGCGKSVLSNSLVDNELRSTTSCTTCYFFFKDESDSQRSIISALCALLHQFFIQKPCLLEKAIEPFRRNGAQFFSSFQNLWSLFIDVTQAPQAGNIVCVLDALDECAQDGKKTLIDSLNIFYSTKEKRNGRLEFLVTSRPYFDIEQLFDNLTIRLSGEEESESIKGEIDLVIKDHVPKVMANLKLDIKTGAVLRERLLMARNRTYLWVHLVLDQVEQSLGVNTPKRMDNFLDEVPGTVSGVYEKMLSQSPQPQKARKMLHIILAAARPLTLREMNMALNLEDGQKSRDEVDLDPIETFASHIKNICGLLVSVLDSRIYLLHQTAKEFLISRGAAPQGAIQIETHPRTWMRSMKPSDSNLVLAKICLVYLLFTVFEDKPLLSDQDIIVKEQDKEHEEKDDSDEYTSENNDNEDSDSMKVNVDGEEDEDVRESPSYYFKTGMYIRKHDLLDYASSHWSHHFQMAEEDEEAVERWIRVCDTQSRRFHTWFALYLMRREENILLEAPKLDFAPLLLASFFGHEVIVRRLANESHLNSADDKSRTPLWWATKRRHASTVSLLLERGATQSEDHESTTPLTLATIAGYDEIVKLFIENGAKIDCKDQYGLTPLAHAVFLGRQNITKLLLQGSAQPDLEDQDGNHPLTFAARYGSEEMVKLLVEDGRADLNYGRGRIATSPLENAVRGGHPGMVSLLLHQGAQPDPEDPESRTPLSHAARLGQEKIVKVLLDGAADPNIKDRKGYTLLAWAEFPHREYCKRDDCGHEEILRLLKPLTLAFRPEIASEHTGPDCGNGPPIENPQLQKRYGGPV